MNRSLAWEWGGESFSLIEPIYGRCLLPKGVDRSGIIFVISEPYFYI